MSIVVLILLIAILLFRLVVASAKYKIKLVNPFHGSQIVEQLTQLGNVLQMHKGISIQGTVVVSTA